MLFLFIVNKLFCRADNVVGSTKDTQVVSSLHTTTTVTYPKQISAPHDLTTSTSVNHHHHHHNNNNSRVVVPINQNNSNNHIRTTSELHQTTRITIDLTEHDCNYLSSNNVVVDDGIIIQSHTNNNNRSQQSSGMSSSGMHHHRPGPSSSHSNHDLRRSNGNNYNGPSDRRMHMNNQDRHSVSVVIVVTKSNKMFSLP